MENYFAAEATLIPPPQHLLLKTLKYDKEYASTRAHAYNTYLRL